MADKLNVAIIDYEMGNVKSIENAIAHVGDFNVVITDVLLHGLAGPRAFFSENYRQTPKDICIIFHF